MNDYRLNGVLWTVGLVVSGALLLLFNFDLLGNEQPMLRYILAAGLALAGVVFFSAFLAAPRHWWRLLPAWTLLALASMVGLSVRSLVRAPILGSLLFVGLALAFAHVYLINRSENWWAIIPGGFMLIVGIVVALSDQAPPLILGALLFVGMGLVFVLVYLLAQRHRQWWALVPAGILIIFGLFVFGQYASVGVGWWRWWPLLLIVAGVMVAVRTLRTAPAEKLTVQSAPGLVDRNKRLTATSPAQAADATAPERGQLGEYRQPAPGASVEILAEGDEG